VVLLVAVATQAVAVDSHLLAPEGAAAAVAMVVVVEMVAARAVGAAAEALVVALVAEAELAVE
jgi:hypothetical protein